MKRKEGWGVSNESAIEGTGASTDSIVEGWYFLKEGYM